MNKKKTKTYSPTEIQIILPNAILMEASQKGYAWFKKSSWTIKTLIPSFPKIAPF